MRSLTGTTGFLFAMLLTASLHAATLHRGNGPEPDSLDPHKAQGLSAQNILRDLYTPLLRIAPDGNPVAGAAQSWHSNEDGLHWEFVLDPNGRWSDGSRVVAQDFVRGWQRALDPNTAAPYVDLIGFLADAEVVAEDDKLWITLARRVPDLLQRLSLLVASPWPGCAGVYNGPYELKQRVLQTRTVLSAQPYHPQKPAFETVVYHVTDDTNAEVNRFRAGDLDITESIPFGRVAGLRDEIPQAVRVSPYFAAYFWGFNLTQPPFRGNRPLRRALTLLVERPLLTDKLIGNGESPLYSLVPPGHGAYVKQEPAWSSWSWDRKIATAKEDFQRSGYTADNPLVLEMRYNQSASHRRVALAMCAMWREHLPVHCRHRSEEWKVFVGNRRAKTNTQLFRWGWTADVADAENFLGLFRSGQALNLAGWQNEAFDHLLDVSATQNSEDRQATLSQAESLLLDDFVILPLYTYVSKHLVRPDIQGWQDHVLDHHPSVGLYRQGGQPSRERGDLTEPLPRSCSL